MPEIIFRKTKQGLVPESLEDNDKYNEISVGSVVRCKVSNVSGKKARSYQQLKAYFGCCRTVANNTEHKDFNTSSKCDLQLRVKLGWIKEYVVVNDQVQFIPKSISYAEMSHLEACNYFERAFEVMAKFLKITVAELLNNSE